MITLLHARVYSFNEILSDSPTWLDEIRCLGTEGRLIDCPANTIGVEDCTHTQDVALVCSSTGKSCITLIHYNVMNMYMQSSGLLLIESKYRLGKMHSL